MEYRHIFDENFVPALNKNQPQAPTSTENRQANVQQHGQGTNACQAIALLSHKDSLQIP